MKDSHLLCIKFVFVNHIRAGFRGYIDMQDSFGGGNRFFVFVAVLVRLGYGFFMLFCFCPIVDFVHIPKSYYIKSYFIFFDLSHS